MAHLIYLSIGILLLALAAPLVLELAAVTVAGWLPRRKRIDVPSSQNLPSIAVVVPAHNEELLVGRCVRSLVAAANARTRIYVIAHNCSDNTADEASRAGLGGRVISRVKVLRYNDPEARGKGHALRYGFEQALEGGADAVLVVDADSIVSENLISEIQHLLAAGADAVQCRYEMKSATDKPKARLAALAWRGFNVIRPRGRERLGLSCGLFGNGFALGSKLLATVPYGAYSVVEDLEYHIHIVLAGKRVRFSETALVTSALPASTEGETSQRSRWEGGRLQAARAWFRPLVGQLLHGRIRVLDPLCDVLSLPLAYGVFALLIALCLPVAGIRIAALASLLVVLAHVLAAAAAGPDFLKTLGLLLMAPLYILWKLRLIPAILSGSNAQAAWVRTQRDPGSL